MLWLFYHIFRENPRRIMENFYFRSAWGGAGGGDGAGAGALAVRQGKLPLDRERKMNKISK